MNAFTSITTTEAALEALTTAQDAHFRAEGTVGEARAESRLFDAAIAAGMSFDHDDLHGWVALTVGAWLVSGPLEEGDDHAGIGTDEFGRWEYVA